MAGKNYTSQSVPYPNRELAGGLNSTAAAMSLQDNEASDLQNIDFDVLGMFRKRAGYTALNTSPFTYGGKDSYTKLLLHMDGTTTTFTDSSTSAKAITAVGSATQSTAQSKFGGKSCYLEGTTSYLTTPDSDDFFFGNQQLTNGDFENWGAAGSSVLTNGDMETWTGLTDVLVDGAMEVWTSPTVLTNWTLQGAGATLNKESTIIKAGTYSAKLARNGVNAALNQALANPTTYRNQILNFGMWVWASVANRACLEIYDGTNDVLSAYHPGDSQWHYLSATITVSGSATYVQCYCNVITGDTTAYFDAGKVYVQLAPTSWALNGSGAYISREEDTVKNGTYSAKLTRNGANCDIYQDITNAGGHNLAYWKGKTITAGFWVNASVASRAYVYIDDGVGSTGSAAHSGSSSWEYLTVTRTIDANATYVYIYLYILNGNTSVYFDYGDCEEPGSLTSWTLTGAGAYVVKESTIVKVGSYSAKVNRNGADTSIYQTVAAITTGKSATFGCWVYATAASRARIGIVTDGTGTTYSSYHTGDSTWQYLTVSATIGGSPTYVRATCQINTGDTIAYFDGGTLSDDTSNVLWTVDEWIYVSSLPGVNKVIWSQATDANNYMYSYITSTGTIGFVIQNGGAPILSLVTTQTVNVGSFNHIEIGESGSNFYAFVNGIVATTSSSSRASNYTGTFQIGGFNSGSNLFSGYIDEFRVSNGICRHTANFTLPNRMYNTETSVPTINGLNWFEKSDGTKYLMAVAGSSLMVSTSLTQASNPFVDMTGTITITPGQNNQISWSTMLDTVVGTNGVDQPFQSTGSAIATALTGPTGLTTAKYTEVFSNYCFLANVNVSGVYYGSRVYWSEIDSLSTWQSTSFRDVNKADGQIITGLKKLGSSLVIFKRHSIWIANFTGDSDIPFVFQQTRSTVGCISGYSIQEVENGLVFMSDDGLYYFDGNNTYKLTDRILSTLQGFSRQRYAQCCSAYLITKNRYISSFTQSGHSTHDANLAWDSHNNAFSVYSGISANCFARVYNSGEEQIFFGDYSGFIYQMYNGYDDYPLNVQTAVNAYYYTKWFDYGDLTSKKAVPQLSIYYDFSNSTMTFSYSFDFEDSDQYTQTFSMSGGTALYGSAIFDKDQYAGSGGNVSARHLTGRGKVIRFKFANATIGETFTIEGFGAFPHAETNVK